MEKNELNLTEEDNDIQTDNKDNKEQLTNENKCVFISGLPYTATQEEIKEKFQSCGIIKEIKIPKYQDTGRNIGYAHIYFKKNKAVKKVKNNYNNTKYYRL
jgi:nucleolin